MHPAFSVIFFTTASGAGYGMLIVLGFFSAMNALPAHFGLGLVAFGLALGAITFGLLSSTFHLGHPERSWRAFSQWRSSWLSREGVLAVATYPVTLLFALGWLWFGDNYGVWALIGLAAAWAAGLTVFSTSMIYASLKTIHQWHSIWTPPAYLALGVMSGGIWLLALCELFDVSNPYITGWVLFSIVVGWIVKAAYWYRADNTESPATPETATGLKVYGRVRAIESPHYVDNYLLREMGYQVARRHAAKLRRVAVLTAFVLPLLLGGATLALGGTWPAMVAALLAALSVSLGVVVERWLFFAEARHAVTLYYGAEAA